MKTATLRTYRKSIGHGFYDYEDRWQCPYCSQKQNFHGNEKTLIDSCLDCGKEVQLKYRIIKSKKF